MIKAYINYTVSLVFVWYCTDIKSLCNGSPAILLLCGKKIDGLANISAAGKNFSQKVGN